MSINTLEILFKLSLFRLGCLNYNSPLPKIALSCLQKKSLRSLEHFKAALVLKTLFWLKRIPEECILCYQVSYFPGIEFFFMWAANSVEVVQFVALQIKCLITELKRIVLE